MKPVCHAISNNSRVWGDLLADLLVQQASTLPCPVRKFKQNNLLLPE